MTATGRLCNGTPWPVPVVLEISPAAAAKISPGRLLFLRDAEGVLLAAVHVDEVWSGNRVAGRVEGLRLPVHNDLRHYRKTPAELRAELAGRGWSRVAAFHARRPMHRAEVEGAMAACRDPGARLLIQAASPPVSTADDPAPLSLVRCLEAVLPAFPSGTALLSILPWGRGGDDEKDALLRAIVARNFGCTHLISPAPASVPPGVDIEFLARAPSAGPTEAEIGRLLDDGRDLPAGFTYPEVAAELRRARPPRYQRGITVFFTGLPTSGKSTTAKMLLALLMERSRRSATLLDGDLVRRMLSSELGFSREHRELNIRRIGYVASEVTRHGGIAICCPIAPYDAVRKEIRARVETFGTFVLVHVSTPLDVCESRDSKGLYARARAGLLPQFTGVSDPYEPPADAELSIDTSVLGPEQAAERVLAYLAGRGLL